MARIPNDFFKTWTSELAYVLGYWWADGGMLRTPLPSAFLRDFVRGFIDGDGSLYWLRTAVTTIPRLEANGTQAFVVDLALALEEAAGIPAPRSRQHGKIWKTVWTGMYAKCLAAWLYSDNDLCLERKRQVARTFLAGQPKIYRKRHITPKMCELFGYLLPEKHWHSQSE